MSDLSANLGLPYLAQSQSQRYVTHNEALQTLDAVVQLSVLARDQTEPPAAPDPGARYIVAAGATGGWAGQESAVALWNGDTWIFISPQTGWRTWVAGENIELVWHDSQWQPLNTLENAPQIGINATADTTNRLSVSAPATLFNNEGAGHQLKINKASTGDTGSLLFQTGFSGRAEMGLAGNDGWSIKVSDNGANWTEALAFDPATGQASGAAVQSNPTDAGSGKLLTTESLVFGGYTAGKTPPGNDLNNHVTPGIVDIAPDTANRPPSSGSFTGVCIVFARDSSHVTQIASEIRGQNASYLYIRTLGTTWGTWVPLVPERGNNANGEYVRFADGTQFCWKHTLISTTVNARTYNETLWVFPAAFASGSVPVPSVNVRSVSGAGARETAARFFKAIGGPSNNVQAYASIVNETGGTQDMRVHVFVSGRWF